MGFKVLGFDASGPSLAVGYLDGDAVWADWRWQKPRLAGNLLVPWISAVVDEFGRPDGIAVGIGPGSFTGVRIAVAAAKALALAWEIPLAGVVSLRAWALGAAAGQHVLVTSERRGTAYYAGFYWRAEDGPVPIWPEQAINGPLPAEFPFADPVTVIGPMTELPDWREQVGPKAQAGDVPLTGSAVARLARIGLQLGQSVSPLALSPLYLRAPAVSRPRGRGPEGG
ncbi:MAG: tRNA (adenosine(37)-N6)-threonylcarbamoyltransferase complex dimerization subunit type 1 TsaB [Thermaerobacter sp.]|nr:tRNA (adenosine(37)-N6)-threonylcarbamoyltransferase complex dimerization subunit type 1 TsaB [Thermaerobacter sp.]